MLRHYFSKRRIIKNLGSIPSDETRRFFRDNISLKEKPCQHNKINTNQEDHKIFKEIMETSGRSHLPLSLNFPAQEMLKEARALASFFVPHREDPNGGWKSLCIHGASAEKTEDYYMYGFKDREAANYCWTEIAEKCPTTVKWLKENWPYEELHRVRFMLLKPGGYITPHNDTDGKRGFHAVNMALNQPMGCEMVLENYGVIPWRSGLIALLDIGVNHSVVNLSKEDRYHIIIHGRAGLRFNEYKKLVLKSAQESHLI